MIIRLLLTGGTFDKEYDELTAELVIKKSHINEILEVARVTSEVTTEQILLKDSLDITPVDRELIVSSCINSKEDNIVIVHGTDTMVETALAIQDAQIKKVVVLTGAMIPFALGTKSDALFNLGSALAFVQTLKPGVYVAMNGRYFNASNVHKDKAAGFFVNN